jgi:predicted PurR-regulated permease PerM
MSMPEQHATRWRHAAVKAWAIIGVLLVTGAVVWMLERVSGALVPFFMAAVIVFMLRGPVTWFEGRGVPRWLSVLMAYLAAATILGVLGFFILPRLAEQLVQFAQAFPGYYAQASRFLADLTSRYWHTMPDWVRLASTKFQATVEARLGGWASALAEGLVAAGGSIAGFVVNGVLAVFIAFYVLVDLPMIRRELLVITSPKWRPEVDVVFGKVGEVVGGFLRGQSIIALANGVLTGLGLWLLPLLFLKQGMPYSGVIGLITGVLSVIPYIGPLVGGLIVGVTGLFVSPMMAVIGLIWMVAVQQVEGNLLSPKIMSEQVDLHPALVIFSLLVGAELGGLVGMLVAIPIAATGKALFVYYFERHTREDITTEDGALFREAKPKKRSGRAGESEEEGRDASEDTDEE